MTGSGIPSGRQARLSPLSDRGFCGVKRLRSPHLQALMALTGNME